MARLSLITLESLLRRVRHGRLQSIVSAVKEEKSQVCVGFVVRAESDRHVAGSETLLCSTNLQIVSDS